MMRDSMYETQEDTTKEFESDFRPDDSVELKRTASSKCSQTQHSV